MAGRTARGIPATTGRSAWPVYRRVLRSVEWQALGWSRRRSAR